MSAIVDQPGLFDAIEADEADRRRLEAHRQQLRACWPEWEGPRVGGLCEVAQPVVRTEDGQTTYAYSEQCRLIERRPDGTWLAVIEMGEVHGKPWWKDGTRLILEEVEIWAPVQQLRAARDATHPTDRSESDE